MKNIPKFSKGSTGDVTVSEQTKSYLIFKVSLKNSRSLKARDVWRAKRFQEPPRCRPLKQLGRKWLTLPIGQEVW